MCIGFAASFVEDVKLYRLNIPVDRSELAAV